MHLSAPIYRLKQEARRLARAEGVALNVAQARIARREGFGSWSLLAASVAGPGPSLLAALPLGGLVMLAAQRGQGKTLLALETLAVAAGAGRAAVFFSLEETEPAIRARLADLGHEGRARQIRIDTSDAICAEHVVRVAGDLPAGAVIAVDYLQLLDQRRTLPPLRHQVAALAGWASAAQVSVILLSQIDRRFDPSEGRMPGPDDLRLPNPVDRTLFARACFLHEGRIRVRPAA